MAVSECTTGSIPAPELPSLALQVVGSFLPPRSIANCRLVCRQWRTVFSTCVDVIYVQVYLESTLTDSDIAAAASIFPSASRAVLLLPNRTHLTWNVYDSTGAAVAAPPLARHRVAANAARRAALLQTACGQVPLIQTAVGVTAAPSAAVAYPEADLAVTPLGADAVKPPDAEKMGRLACAAALTSLRQHLPGLRMLQIGEAQRPTPRPGPEAALLQCLSPETKVGEEVAFVPPPPHTPLQPHDAATIRKASRLVVATGEATAAAEPEADLSMTRTGGGQWAASNPDPHVDSWSGVENACMTTVRRAACAYASCWGYPATLLPPEGAIVWNSHAQEVAQIMAEQTVDEAHRAAPDLVLMVLPAQPPPISCLDLRCAVGLMGLVPVGAPSEGLAMSGTNLASSLTALTVLQLRDGGQLAALRRLPKLASLDLWCCDGTSRTDMSYWTSAAPQRIRRGLPGLVETLTALTSLVLRELAAQVEPPPPVGALAALPLLRSLTLELVYDNPWRELAELAEQLQEGEDEGHDNDDDDDDEEEEEEEEDEMAEEAAELLAALHYQLAAEEERRTAVNSTATNWDVVMLESCIQRDSLLLHRRGPLIQKVVGKFWKQLRDSQPLDLFSCFAHATSHGNAREPARVVETRGSLTHLDVTFLGAALLPGVWHGICQLGSSLTRLALRVGRSPLEERLVANLQGSAPSRWPPGSFKVHSLEFFPHLRHLLLDAPLETHIIASLAAQSPDLSCVKSPVMSCNTRQPPAIVAPGLESLELLGLWPSVSFQSAAAPSPGVEPASETVDACYKRSSFAQSPLVLPHRSLRTLHLDGDLRYLVSELATGALCGARLVDLRLAHQPVGRPARRNLLPRGEVEGGLPLCWSLLPQDLERLELEGFDVYADSRDSGDGTSGCTTRLSASEGHSVACDIPSSGKHFQHLEKLQLRHCVAALSGVYDSHLGEVSIRGCWLLPAASGEGPSPAAPMAEAVLPPWDVVGQVQLLCQQPWAQRLLRLDLQLIRCPDNSAAASVTEEMAGFTVASGHRSTGWDDSPGAKSTTSALRALEHLSLTWELAALPRGPRTLKRCNARAADKGPRLPSVGLPVGLASRWVASLPAGLRSLELCLGDEHQDRPLSVEECCGPWLLQFRRLRRLRLVLAVSHWRSGTHDHVANAVSGCEVKGQMGLIRMVGNPVDFSDPGIGAVIVDGQCGETNIDSGGGNAGCGRGGVGQDGAAGTPADSTVISGGALIASAWVYAELTDLLNSCLPYCQCHAVQVCLD